MNKQRLSAVPTAMALRLFAVGLLVAAYPGSVGAQSFQLLEATIEDVHAALESGQITCRTLVQHYMDRIDAYDKTGPALNAVQHLNPRALDEAHL